MRLLLSLKKIKEFRLVISVGFFLAVRQIRRSTFWTTSLIVFVMTLTFLNMVFIGGILVGLIEGVSVGFQKDYTGDLLISTLPTKQYIEQSQGILSLLQNIPEIKNISARYIIGGTAEANFKESKPSSDLPDRINTTFVGINPTDENNLTNISNFIIEGQFLQEGDYGYVVLGSDLIGRLARGIPGDLTLNNVEIGDTIRVVINGITRDVIIKGIIQSKVGNVNLRIYTTGRELRKLAGRDDLNVDEIALRLSPGVSAKDMKSVFVNLNINKSALIQTAKEAQPNFLKDVAATFNILGSVFGSIGLIVSSITIFIVIFVNAITRKKFIGILKAIGIRESVIETSYVFQSIFYAIAGTLIGVIILYVILIPYFNNNPIDFPFSDGILFVTSGGVLVRVFALIVATVIAGYIPARLITKGNTLDAILGR